MHVSKLAGHAVALGGLASRVMAQASDDDCPEGITIVELQPVEIIHLGPPRSTETLTLTRTQTVDGGRGDPGFTTITRPASGTFTQVITIPPQGDGPGTVIVPDPVPTDGPGEFVTVTRPPSATFTGPVTVPGTGGEPGTVFVPGPAPSPSLPGFDTITTVWDGPTTRTRTVAGSGTVPGTIIIETPIVATEGPGSPPTFNTITTEWDGPTTRTRTIVGTGTVPGTIIVETPGVPDGLPTSSASAPAETTPAETTAVPLETVTITEPYDGISSTSSLIPAVSGAPPTLVIQPPRCTAGVAWAYYNLEEGDGAGQIPRVLEENWPAWLTEIFSISTSMSGQSPELVGQSTTIGGGIVLPPENLVIYGQDTGNEGPWTLIHHTGYFSPSQAGDYIFAAPEGFGPAVLDDAAYLWLGDNAVSGYTNDNADEIYVPNRGRLEYTYTVSEEDVGSFIPFRWMAVNAQSGFSWPFQVVDPSGQDIFSITTETDDGQFVNGCEGSTEAPPFDF